MSHVKIKIPFSSRWFADRKEEELRKKESAELACAVAKAEVLEERKERNRALEQQGVISAKEFLNAFNEDNFTPSVPVTVEGDVLFAGRAISFRCLDNLIFIDTVSIETDPMCMSINFGNAVFKKNVVFTGNKFEVGKLMFAKATISGDILYKLLGVSSRFSINYGSADIKGNIFFGTSTFGQVHAHNHPQIARAHFMQKSGIHTDWREL